MTKIKYLNEYAARHGAPYWEDPAPGNEPLNYFAWALCEAVANEYGDVMTLPDSTEYRYGIMYTTTPYRDDYVDDWHELQVYAEPYEPAITFYVDDVRVHVWQCDDIIDLANKILDYSWDALYSDCLDYGYQAFIEAGASDSNPDAFNLSLLEHVNAGNFMEV